VKELEQAIVRSRAKMRNFRARIPLLSRGVSPVRVVLFLESLENTAEDGTVDYLSPTEWKEALVAFVGWLGPVRVCLDTTGTDATDLALELVRFANRLECPTHLVSTGPVSEAQALEFIDRGLCAVTLRVGGLDERTQQAILHSSLDATATSLAAFGRARSQRTRSLILQVNIPAHEDNLESLGSIAGWAHQAGADEVCLGLLLGHSVPPGLVDKLNGLSGVNTPSALSGFIKGASGGGLGARVSLRSNGDLHASTALPPLGSIREASPEELWRSHAGAVQEAIRHPRPFDEVELIPGELRSQR
jgi:hypothetical protein